MSIARQARLPVKELVTELVRRWWLAVVLVLLGALAGLAYGLLTPAEYAAKAYVVVVAQDSTDNTAVSYAQAYSRITGQGAVLAAAASASNGAASPQELRRSVRASSSPDAPIIEITGSGRPAGHAADLANLVANAITDTANRNSAQTRVRLVLLSAAVAPDSPASPRPLLDLAVGAAAGLLLAGLALLGRSSRTAVGGGQRPAMTGVRTTTDLTTTAALDNQRWIGTATVFPPAAPVDGVSKDRPALNGRATNQDDQETGDDGSAPQNGPSRRNGPQRKQRQRVARRNNARRRRPR